ncbi:MAG: hybrid sensor histidine kinase/response regulator, partial [Acaryochloridaceae cyanobacterium RL_2_7]|nr:hybrid sensor histidine kinase/response regulator [Acaryochloridaceae cyanobacterium RL_2_7]
MIESSIRDQAYQIFQEEALELLQLIEEGLIKLQEEYETPHIHQLMRAAHSIKGGAASVGLQGIQKIAHRLEDIFRALYQRQDPVDDDTEEALLQAYDCLKDPLQTQIETGSFDEEAAWEKAEPIFAVLETVLQHELESSEYQLPSAAELGIDLVSEIFNGNVQEELTRLTHILEASDESNLAEEVKGVANVLEELGNLLGLDGFTAIAQSTVQALTQAP